MNRYLKFPGAALILAALAACSGEDQAPAQDSAAEPEAAAEVQVAGNPFFAESPHYFNFPPFDLIANEHYQPAFEVGMAEQIAEVEAIAGQEAAPDFENTIVALELSGQLLNRVSSVFFALSSAHTNDDIQALQQQLAPELAAHYDAILLNRDLFARISALHESRDDLGLDPESHRLLERTHIDFIRAGAGLSEEQQEQLRDINARVAVLETRFSQNVLGRSKRRGDRRRQPGGIDRP